MVFWVILTESFVLLASVMVKYNSCLILVFLVSCLTQGKSIIFFWSAFSFSVSQIRQSRQHYTMASSKLAEKKLYSSLFLPLCWGCWTVKSTYTNWQKYVKKHKLGVPLKYWKKKTVFDCFLEYFQRNSKLRIYVLLFLSLNLSATQQNLKSILWHLIWFQLNNPV